MMTFRSMHASVVALAGAAMLTLVCGSAAQAAACRDIASVKSSANPDANTAAGGHMTQHILGMTPPPGMSQLTKTLFADKSKAQAAWRQYGYIDNPVACGAGSAQSQSVTVEKLGMGKLDAFSCTQANAQGQCTKWDSYVAKSIFYGFALNNGKWILNTMYPEPLTP
jgi:hypothetical protein